MTKEEGLKILKHNLRQLRFERQLKLERLGTLGADMLKIDEITKSIQHINNVLTKTNLNMHMLSQLPDNTPISYNIQKI